TSATRNSSSSARFGSGVSERQEPAHLLDPGDSQPSRALGESLRRGVLGAECFVEHCAAVFGFAGRAASRTAVSAGPVTPKPWLRLTALHGGNPVQKHTIVF
ncbi:MAG: hypothetical protein ABJD68_05590, partial [Nakamurella sp.]